MSPSTATDIGLLPPGIELPAAKRRLYEAAMELFGRDGYHAVSIRDIANALGQQPSAIYFHVEQQAGAAVRAGADRATAPTSRRCATR